MKTTLYMLAVFSFMLVSGIALGNGRNPAVNRTALVFNAICTDHQGNEYPVYAVDTVFSEGPTFSDGNQRVSELLMKRGPATVIIRFDLVREIILSPTSTDKEGELLAELTLVDGGRLWNYLLDTQVDGKYLYLRGFDQTGMSTMIPISACAKVSITQSAENLGIPVPDVPQMAH